MRDSPTPYRPEPKEEPKMGIEAFGVVKIGDRWKPILERYKGPWPCKNCRGFGTRGNPLCGAVYLCKKCQGSGKATPPWWWSLWQAMRRAFGFKTESPESENA